MELNLNKEPVFLSEVVFDGQAEQGVEFDYVLPDYYPDIFKILKCSLTPCVVSHGISGAQLNCDGVVYIKVLYLSEDGKPYCIEQRYTYSKSIELNREPGKALVRIIPKADYCNCRAVSNRRLDVRGAVSCKIKVIGTKSEEIITGAEGMGLETRIDNVSYSGERFIGSKQFVVREDIEAAGRGAVSGIIYCDVSAEVTDCKLIPDKAILKGEAHIKALYLTKNANGDNEPEIMEASVPLSQIVDIAGVGEAHTCSASFYVMDCDLEAKNSDGENRLFSCELTVCADVSANLEKALAAVSDTFSTDYESEYSTSILKLSAMPVKIDETIILKSSLDSKDGTISTVFDARTDIGNIVFRAGEDGGLIITGQANYQALALLDSGSVVYIEKNEPFELSVPSVALPDEYELDLSLEVISTGYSISGDSTIDLRVQLLLSGVVYEQKSAEFIKNIAVLSDSPKEKNSEYALKLYYADENEDLWSIAKHYNTSVSAITAENDIEGDTVKSAAMLLIPII